MNRNPKVPQPEVPSVRHGQKTIELHALVGEISSHYPDLKVPSEEELKNLEVALGRVDSDKETTIYIVATVAAVFFLLSFPILVVWGYDVAGSVQLAILPYLDQSEFLRTRPGVSAGLILAAMGAFSYALVMHISALFRIPKRYWRSLEPPWGAISKNTWRFRLYQVVMVCLALAVAILYLHSFLPEARPYSALAVRIWLFLPALVLSIFPTIVVIAMFAAAFVRERHDADSTHAAILREVLLLLQILKDASHPRHLVMSTRVDALNHISRASSMLERLYANGGAHSRVARWANIRMARVADEFLALSAWVLFPMEDSVRSLRQHLVVYANVLVVGNLNDLPAEAIAESLPFTRQSRKRGYFHRLGNLMWLLLLVILPLLVYLALGLWAGHTLPAPLQTPAAITYSAWVGVCLLAHIEDLAPEAKNTLVDVVKVVFRR